MIELFWMLVIVIVGFVSLTVMELAE